MNLINLQRISDELTNRVISWQNNHPREFTEDDLSEIITGDISSEIHSYIEYLEKINFQGKLKELLGDLYVPLDDEEDEISINIFFIPGSSIFEGEYPGYYFIDVLIDICNLKFEVGGSKIKEYPYSLYPHYSTVEMDNDQDILYIARVANIILNNPEIDDIYSLQLLVELK